jgi:hypothetical protein
MFRARLLAQAFTLVALCAGSAYWAEDRKKWKEFEGIVEERKKREKNEAWIRELEARDEEDKREREARGRRRLGKEGAGVRDTVARVVGKEREGKEVELKVEGAVESNVKKEGKSVLDSVKALIWSEPKK